MDSSKNRLSNDLTLKSPNNYTSKLHNAQIQDGPINLLFKFKEKINEQLQIVRHKKYLRERNSLKQQEEVQKLLEIFGKLPFFQKYDGQGNEMLLKCCQQMKLQEFQAEEIVFEIDTPGENFYLIVEGEVDIYSKSPELITQMITKDLLKPQKKQKSKRDSNLQNRLSSRIEEITLSFIQTIIKDKQQSNENIKQPEKHSIENLNISINIDKNNQTISHDSRKSIRKNSTIVMLSSQIKKNEDEKLYTSNFETQRTDYKMEVKNSKVLNFVKRLYRGNSFGEMSLIYSKPRLATVKCVTKCLMGVLSKKQFTLILKQQEEKKINKELNQLKEISLFKNWSPQVIQEIYLNSEIVTFKRGDVIFSKGDIPEAVYFIQSGEFCVNIYINQKYLDCYFTQIKDIIEFHHEEREQEEGEREDNNQNRNQESIDSLLKNKGGHSIFKEFSVLKLSAKEMFGEEDVISSSKRRYKAECQSLVGSLFRIRSFDFLTRVMQRNQFAKQCVLERMKIKKEYFQMNEKKIKEQYLKFKDYLLNNDKKGIRSSLVFIESPKNDIPIDLSQHSTYKESQMKRLGPRLKFLSVDSVERRLNELAWRQEDCIKGSGTTGTQNNIIDVDNQQQNRNKVKIKQLPRNQTISFFEENKSKNAEIPPSRNQKNLPQMYSKLNKSLSEWRAKDHSIEFLNQTTTSNFRSESLEELSCQRLSLFESNSIIDTQIPSSSLQNRSNISLQSQEKKICVKEVKKKYEQNPQEKVDSNPKKDYSFDKIYFDIQLSDKKKLIIQKKFERPMKKKQIKLENSQIEPIKKILKKVIFNQEPLLTDTNLFSLSSKNCMNRMKMTKQREYQIKKKVYQKEKQYEFQRDIEDIDHFISSKSLNSTFEFNETPKKLRSSSSSHGMNDSKTACENQNAYKNLSHLLDFNRDNQYQ